MDYLNPNDYWMNDHYDPYKGMDDEERTMAGCLHTAICVGVVLAGMLLCALLTGCGATKYVAVPEVHEHWHHSVDTITRTDSVIDRQTTLIREVDSATMAQYGIQMSAMQTAWLIQTDRLQQEINRMREATRDTVHERDSVSYPVEVVKEVPARMSATEQTMFWIGLLTVIGGIIFGAAKLRKFIPNL